MTSEQRERLEIVQALGDTLRIEIMTFDLIACAHWVATGTYIVQPDDSVSDDSALWKAGDDA